MGDPAVHIHPIEDAAGQVAAYYQVVRVGPSRLWVVVTDLDNNLVGKAEDVPADTSDAEIADLARSLWDQST